MNIFTESGCSQNMDLLKTGISLVIIMMMLKVMRGVMGLDVKDSRNQDVNQEEKEDSDRDVK